VQGQSSKVKVGTITFQGNTVFSNQKLVRAMHNSRPYAIPLYLFSIPVSSKTFDKAKLNDDLEGGVRALYQNDGYFKVLAGDPVLETVDGSKATNIVIPIKEGAQYRMGHLVIRSADPDKPLAASCEALEAVLSLKTGDIFDVRKVRKAINTYTELSGQPVKPVLAVNSISKTIDLTFDFEARSQASLSTVAN
jgi:outer membrane protein insertion porin family